MEEPAVNGLTSDYALYDTVCMADYEKTIMQEDISGCVDDIKSENGHIVTSIFIGGGTPSAIDAEDISDILDAVRRIINEVIKRG